MDPTSAAGVRALAAWLQARRELTERVEVLLMHGPTAVERVTRHLDELRAGYARELAAFDAFTGPRGGPPEPGLPDPRATADRTAEPEDGPGRVVSLDEPAAYPPLRSVVLPP